jgi:hypothetical protein
MTLCKHKSIRNKRCGSKKCDKPVSRRILFSLGFSASFCEKCADELIQNNLGTEQRHTWSSSGKNVTIANRSLIGEDG